MDIQTDITTVNPMQATEAFPLEDRSLSANEVLAQQQSALADSSNTAPFFVP